MKLRVFAAAIVAALALGGSARAGLLVDLEDPGIVSNSPAALKFFAEGSLTMIEFAGYQVPAFESVTKISLQKGGAGPNLLGTLWTYTPAPSGALAFQAPDGEGTGTNGLRFGGTVEDSFDRFSQNVATVAGDSYTLSFLYSNETANLPAELMVSEAAAPEPATLTLLGIGMAGMAGYAWRWRKLATV